MLHIHAIMENTRINADYDYRFNNWELTVKDDLTKETKTVSGVESDRLAAVFCLMLQTEGRLLTGATMLNLYELAEPVMTQITDDGEHRELRIIP